MIEMSVAGILLDAATKAPIVLLRDTTKRRALPIWISQDQARAIDSVLKGQRLPRPMTHDLLTNLLGQWEMNLERVIIHALQDQTFYAILKVRRGEEVKELDARPSDAIAIALRLGTPIWVMEEVVADASIPVDQEADEQERAEFRQFLSGLNPSDFTQRNQRSGSES
ncbi:MAG: bifunctional nuclease family protein [Cyanobacteria bacterium P01_H01_bin.121]